MEIVTYLNSIFWGWLVAGILLSCGIFYTLRLGFPQIRYFTKLIHNLQTDSVNNKGVSAFGALCSAIGSEVGAGSLVGVATALASGGPRAISWMWVTAILGMPIMFGEAVLAQLIVLLTHIDFLRDMVTLIIDSAFGIQQAAGGVLGYSVQEAFRYGIARGLFSNDAGAGITPSMHASANVRHPVNQGLSGMLGVFVTTIIVCSCTAFCILLSGQLGSGLPML